MKRLVPIALAVLLLAGCSASPEGSAPDVTPVVKETKKPDSPYGESQKSPRGNLIKKVGQLAGLDGQDGTLWANFVVNAITIDEPCTEPNPSPVENGHIIALSMDVETFPDLDGQVSFSPYAWKFIDASGTTFNGEMNSLALYGCLPADQTLPNSIGPAEKVTGKVLLDIPSTAGTLVYSPGGGAGWEWVLPQ